MAETILREVMANWPPTVAAGLPDAPIVELTDVIRQASVSKEGYLVLSLSRDRRSFTAAEGISHDRVDAVKRLTPQLPGKNIVMAGRLVLRDGG